MHTYLLGNLAKYTGKKKIIYGGLFYEVSGLEHL
jgi:hypothetical protein